MYYREVTEIMVGESPEEAVERCKDALKERLWKEVWRDAVEVSGAEVHIEGGRVEVTLGESDIF
jgi:hypothetical protein